MQPPVQVVNRPSRPQIPAGRVDALRTVVGQTDGERSTAVLVRQPSAAVDGKPAGTGEQRPRPAKPAPALEDRRTIALDVLDGPVQDDDEIDVGETGDELTRRARARHVHAGGG